MSLPPGTRLGPYEIVAPLGAGAMGEVYRARDPRLGRDVAMKVLPPAFGTDADRMHRFEQEARAAGSLQHPNIATVFDVGTEGGTAYVVQELVPGGTLRGRLERGPLPVREALRLAAGIASGLAAAHEKGIVHRDLKPENVALAAEDRPQILDFGLARVAVRSEDATVSVKDSAAGLVIGTVGYMAPEQVRGEPTDARADLFAVGTMLHEMLTGARTFSRGSAVETLHSILADEPPSLPAAVPGAVARVVARCLEKDPARRFQSARDLAFALELFAGEGAPAAAGPAAGTARPRGRVPWLLVALAVVAAASAFVAGRRTAPRPADVTVRVATLSQGTRDAEPAVSPDGRLIVFSAVREGGQGLWIMDVVTRTEVRLTSGVDNLPRFSPDGGTVLFSRTIANRRSLWRVAAIGGTARPLVEAGSDADWSPDGQRVAYVTGASDSTGSRAILVVARADGTDAREVWSGPAVVASNPRWSPDGRRMAFVRSGSQNSPNALLVVDADGGPAREYPSPNRAVLSNALWDRDGQGLVVAEGEGILALQRGASGRLYRVDLRSASYRPLGWLGDFPLVIDALPDGRLVMAPLLNRQNLLEVPLDARSLGEGHWLTRGMSIDRQPVYAPDGETVMFSSNRGGTLDLWEVSVRTGEMHRVTHDPADDWDPAYGPGGDAILWSSNRTGPFEIWTARRDGTAPRQVSNDSLDAENPALTPDGRHVIYTSSHPAKSGLWEVPFDQGAGRWIAAGAMLIPDLSPDGRYVSVITGVQTLQAALSVFDRASGAALPHDLPCFVTPGSVQFARSRWTADGRAVVFIGQDALGRGVLMRRALEGWTTGHASVDTLFTGARDAIESFGLSPDGRRAVVSVIDWLSGLQISEPIAGLGATRAGR